MLCERLVRRCGLLGSSMSDIQERIEKLRERHLNWVAGQFAYERASKFCDPEDECDVCEALAIIGELLEENEPSQYEIEMAREHGTMKAQLEERQREIERLKRHTPRQECECPDCMEPGLRG